MGKRRRERENRCRDLIGEKGRIGEIEGLNSRSNERNIDRERERTKRKERERESF